MIIEYIKIKNIRSIKNLELDFPPSTMLFFGDVGSGKSSVLKAIEFGLFGVLHAADLSGDSLLRRGENAGSVNLTFSINGKKYSIKRELKRIPKKRKGGKKYVVSQDTGSIIEITDDNMVKTSLASTDLRRKILNILNYSITRYEKAHKIPLFRYTVYTPQEQVKEILQVNADERFEILKEVFGIEKYEIALKNVGIINKFLHDKKKEFKVYLNTIGNPELLISDKEKEIEQQKDVIKGITVDKKKKEKDIKKEELITEKIQLELNEYSKRSVEIDNYQEILNEAVESKEKNEKNIESLTQDILNSEKEIANFLDIKLESDLTEKQLENQLEKLRENQLEKDKERAILEKNIENIDKLLKEGKCSLCGQQIHERERFNIEHKKTKSKIKKLSLEIQELLSNITKFEKNLRDIRDYTLNQIKLDSLNELIKEKKNREAGLKDLINQLDYKIERTRNQILIILKKYKIKDMQKFKELEKELKSKLIDQKNRVKNLVTEKSEMENKLNSEQANLKISESKLNELKENLKKKKVLKEKLEYITDLKNWIIEKFEFLIRDIEREIISASARQFNEYFKEWFRDLVEEENIEVEISMDDFEPIISVNGYDSPFNDLSGGEKSAISLAYRLALNKIINERHQDIKTKDLLILDEPTDGFSQEQINKMQDILEKLNTAQMIIISHNRNLDSFVTDIFNFTKENHITKVKKEVF